MLTGKKLGAAIAEAIRMKGVSKAQVARHFGIKPPSISDWCSRGTIDKSKLENLFYYFSDVVGPEHWGMRSTLPTRCEQNTQGYHVRSAVIVPASRDESQLIDLFRAMSESGKTQLIGMAKLLVAQREATKAKRSD
jgi:hypothetical protein